MNDIDDMSVDELRIAIAIAKDFTDIKSRWGNLTGKQWIVGPASDSFLIMPIKHWSSSIAAAYELENEIQGTDRYLYAYELVNIVGQDEPDLIDVTNWVILHATPVQRCKAWLKWREAKNEHST